MVSSGWKSVPSSVSETPWLCVCRPVSSPARPGAQVGVSPWVSVNSMPSSTR